MIASGEISGILDVIILVLLVLAVGVIDILVFRNMDRLANQLDPSWLAVTEAVFGVLLAALAVKLMVDGLDVLGVVEELVH